MKSTMSYPEGPIVAVLFPIKRENEYCKGRTRRTEGTRIHGLNKRTRDLLGLGLSVLVESVQSRSAVGSYETPTCWDE